MKEISRDKRLNFPEKLWYLFYNFWRAVGGWRPGGTTFWWPAVVDDDTETVYRKIMDQFLLAFLPKLTAGEGKTVLDVGCGSGYIREHLTRIGFRGRYVGVDPSADWEGGQTHAFPNEMARVPIELFETADRFDLILSLTALEHVLDDGAAIERLRTLGRPGGHELHLVPASCSLFTYLFHGYRQYSIARVRRLFRGRPYQVFRLGGVFSFLLQTLFLNWPERICPPLSIRRFRIYRGLVRLATRLDRWVPCCPGIYAVLVSCP